MDILNEFLKNIFHYQISYKSFIRPHVDYADIIYDKPNNVSFKSKIENVQYLACIAIADAIQGTSCERFYRDLELENL